MGNQQAHLKKGVFQYSLRRTRVKSSMRNQQVWQKQRRRTTSMNKYLSSRGHQATTQSFQFGKALWQLPLHSLKIFIKPSVNTLSEVMGNASLRLVVIQFLSFVIITSTISILGLVIPSTALHGIMALSVGFVRPLGWLPFPLNGITLVLASFFIGMCIAYVCSKICGGKGTFLAHLSCLLVCTVPLVTVSGALLLLPATGWLLQVLGGIVSALFLYRMVLHTITIMAVHRLRADQAILIVLILPLAILAMVVIVGLFCNHGEGIGDFCTAFFDVGDGQC